MGFGESMGNAFGGIMSSGRSQKDARKNREMQMEFAQNLPWEPAYASDTAPTYQKTQSPVARAYLESFLLGQNPDSTFSGSPNAQGVKDQQQLRTNAAYGTPQDRQAMQQKLMTETPWAVTKKPMNGESVLGPKGAEKLIAEARAPDATAVGLDYETIQAISKDLNYPADKLLGDEFAQNVGEPGMLRIKNAYTNWKASGSKKDKKKLQNIIGLETTVGRGDGPLDNDQFAKLAADWGKAGQI